MMTVILKMIPSAVHDIYGYSQVGTLLPKILARIDSMYESDRYLRDGIGQQMR